jgi:hypothetical protein
MKFVGPRAGAETGMADLRRNGRPQRSATIRQVLGRLTIGLGDGTGPDRRTIEGAVAVRRFGFGINPATRSAAVLKNVAVLAQNVLM